WGLLALKADVFEIACVPQRVEIPLNRGLIVDVAGVGKNPAADGIGRNAAVAVNDDLGGYGLLRRKSSTEHKHKCQQTAASPGNFFTIECKRRRFPARRPPAPTLLPRCRLILRHAKNRLLPQLPGVWKTAIIR